MRRTIAYHFLALLVLVAPVAVFAQFQPISGNEYGISDQSVSGIITKFLKYLLYMIGILGVLGFVISGIMYLTAAGDQGIIDRAKKTLTYSIVGILVGLIGSIAVRWISGILAGSSTRI